MIETPFHFNGSLNELLLEVMARFPSIDWSIHESDAYHTGSYILGKSGSQKITIEVEVENERYEVAIN